MFKGIRPSRKVLCRVVRNQRERLSRSIGRRRQRRRRPRDALNNRLEARLLKLVWRSYTYPPPGVLTRGAGLTETLSKLRRALSFRLQSLDRPVRRFRKGERRRGRLLGVEQANSADEVKGTHAVVQLVHPVRVSTEAGLGVRQRAQGPVWPSRSRWSGFRLSDLLHHLGFRGLAAVQFETHGPELSLDQSLVDDLQRRHLFSNEQHALPRLHSARDDVRNRLRLAGAGWTLDHQVLSREGFLDGDRLRAVRVSDVN